MHEESEFPVTLALSPEKEACLKEGPGIFCVKLENGPVPGARRPGSAGGPTLFRCKLEGVTFQHVGAADTDTGSTLL